MKRPTTIALTRKGKKVVDVQMASGRYVSASQIVDEALDLLNHRVRQQEAFLSLIDAGVDRGMADARAGRISDFDDGAVERIKRCGRELLSQRRRKSA